MQKFVYEFTEGGKDQKDLLGGKGANLAEMTRLGLPVPPGFTVTTEACRRYLDRRGGAARAAGPGDPGAARAWRTGSAAGSATPQDPLLVSVRSGAKFSMPGMMETVLNVGLNDASVRGPGRGVRATSASRGTPTAGWSQMFGKTVLDIDGELFAEALDAAKRARGRDRATSISTATDLEELVETFKEVVARARPGGTSRRTRASSSTWRCARSSTRGTPTGRGSTGAASGSRTTSAPR